MLGVSSLLLPYQPELAQQCFMQPLALASACTKIVLRNLTSQEVIRHGFMMSKRTKFLA